MKALEWQRFMEAQRQQHGKTVFTVTELANASGNSPRVLNVELDRLLKRGIIVRYAHGRYGLAGALEPESLLPHLDGGAYMTGAYALYRQNVINQVLTRITCFTNRRHNRSRVRETAAGRFTFVCVRPPIYAPPAGEPFAPPEQALCDLVYLMRRQGLDPRSLYTFRNLSRLNPATLRETALRYPLPTRRMVEDMVAA